MEAAGEIWIEEESPIFNQMKDNTSVTAVEVKVSSHTFFSNKPIINSDRRTRSHTDTSQSGRGRSSGAPVDLFSFGSGKGLLTFVNKCFFLIEKFISH